MRACVPAHLHIRDCQARSSSLLLGTNLRHGSASIYHQRRSQAYDLLVAISVNEQEPSQPRERGFHESEAARVLDEEFDRQAEQSGHSSTAQIWEFVVKRDLNACMHLTAPLVRLAMPPGVDPTFLAAISLL